jgi:predicted DNA-binding ribbon-helix-helix protein
VKGRTRRVTVMLESADYKSLVAMAEREEMSLSSFVRRMIDAHRKIAATLSRQAEAAAAEREAALLDAHAGPADRAGEILRLAGVA